MSAPPGPRSSSVPPGQRPDRLQLSGAQRTSLERRARLLAATSVSYNAVEAIVAIVAGTVASSVALIGFGLDSILETSSGLIILWQFRHPLPESRERRALRMLAWSFFVLAAYVGLESVRTLAGGHVAERSDVGILLALASLVVMPFLSWAQRRTGRSLGSATVVADSKQTLLCTYLSVVLLVGLVLNASLGWWWADPMVGLVVCLLAVKEGRDAWRGDACCLPVPVTDHDPALLAPGPHVSPEREGCRCAAGCGVGSGDA